MSDIRLVYDWLRHSHNNLIVARHSFYDLYPKQTEIVCYLSHQCAETALKAYLVFLDNDPPRIHNLLELCTLCVEQDKEFSTIKECCARLTPYGVETRYPNELAVDDKIAEQALIFAQKVYDFCMSKIPDDETASII
jgi:HEPN domain-containing protein